MAGRAPRTAAEKTHTFMHSRSDNSQPESTALSVSPERRARAGARFQSNTPPGQQWLSRRAVAVRSVPRPVDAAQMRHCDACLDTAELSSPTVERDGTAQGGERQDDVAIRGVIPRSGRI